MQSYSSSGKSYNNECAIISMTSWRARINTCSKTIFSLLKNCPGFHIVLVLSEEEFPLKEKELPDDLTALIYNKLIELLWIYPNIGVFKKILFTMDKYRNAPIISADDDYIYIYNYAQELYDEWCKNKNCVITFGEGFRKNKIINSTTPSGSKSIYPPNIFKTYGLKFLSNKILSTNNDDGYYGYLIYKLKLGKIINPYNQNHIVGYVHDELCPLHKTKKYYSKTVWIDIKKDIDNAINK